jgi:hypothetical protein
MMIEIGGLMPCHETFLTLVSFLMPDRGSVLA